MLLASGHVGAPGRVAATAFDDLAEERHVGYDLHISRAEDWSVTVSGPEMDYLPDLIAIAAELHANLIGDDGEHYTAEDPVG